MSKTILLVEDDETLLELLSITLQMHGYQVLAAKHGLQAKMFLETHGDDKVDLMLVDMLMPIMDGIQLLLWMKKNHIRIPVIVLTALLKKDVEQDLKNVSVEQVFFKPVDAEALLNKVDEVLAN